MKLGDKVICKSYLKKCKCKYVYANKTHRDKDRNYGETNEYILLEDNDCINLPTREVVKCKPFEAIVVGKVSVSTSNYYEQATSNIYDPVTWGWVDTEYLDAVKILKDDYIDCYKVYYRMGMSRYVPVEDIEKVE